MPEPSLGNGAIKTARKGVATYRVTAYGKAAHAGIEPENGVSAIAELAYQINRILDLADHPRGRSVA